MTRLLLTILVLLMAYIAWRVHRDRGRRRRDLVRRKAAEAVDLQPCARCGAYAAAAAAPCERPDCPRLPSSRH